MRLYLVSHPSKFDDWPELAMGIHFAERIENQARSNNTNDDDGSFIVFNSVLAIPVSELWQADRALAPRDLEKVLNGSDKAAKVAVAPCDSIERLLRVLHPNYWIRRRFESHGRVHGSPPFLGSTRTGDCYVRFSAFSNDRRVTIMGGLLPGTYATSGRDAAMVATALSAVGHYALPSIVPPCFRYEIAPPALTELKYGTVAPAYGQSGGGTEIEFFRGVADGACSGPLMIPFY